MDKITLRYTGGKTLAKLYYNRVRYIFNKENDFTTEVPLGVWNFVKQTNEFIPAPIAEKAAETPKEEAAPEKPVDETVCDVCGFKAKSKTGAIAHKRIKHKGGK